MQPSPLSTKSNATTINTQHQRVPHLSALDAAHTSSFIRGNFLSSTISGSDLHRFINSGYLNGDSHLQRGVEPKTPKSPHFHRPPNFSYSRNGPNYVTPYRSSAHRANASSSDAPRNIRITSTSMRGRSSSPTHFHNQQQTPQKHQTIERIEEPDGVTTTIITTTTKVSGRGADTEEPIRLSKFAGGFEPNPDETPKIESLDWPSPPYPAAVPELRARSRSSSNRHVPNVITSIHANGTSVNEDMNDNDDDYDSDEEYRDNIDYINDVEVRQTLKYPIDAKIKSGSDNRHSNSAASVSSSLARAKASRPYSKLRYHNNLFDNDYDDYMLRYKSDKDWKKMLDKSLRSNKSSSNGVGGEKNLENNGDLNEEDFVEEEEEEQLEHAAVNNDATNLNESKLKREIEEIEKIKYESSMAADALNEVKMSKIDFIKLKEASDSIKIIKECHKIKCGQIMDAKSCDFLHKLSYRSSTCKEYIFPALISSIGHLMQNSSIKALANFNQGFVFYTCLVGFPATGKSIGMNLIKEAMYEIEQFLSIVPEDSKLVNAATTEAVLNYLNEFKHVLGLWDESSTLMCSFGLYKGKGGDQYDRGILNELFNAFRSYKRDLKTSRTVISNPRLNISVLGHPKEYKQACQNERIEGDGLISRFIVDASPPVYLTSAEIMETPENEFSLSVFFYIIFYINKSPKEYIFSKEAAVFYNEANDKIKKIIQKANLIDTFISSMLGKSIQHILRLAGVFFMLKFSVKICHDLTKEIRFKLKKELEAHLDTINITNEVDLESVNYAFNYIAYTSKHRLLLAGYNFLDKEDFLELLDDILDSGNSTKKELSLHSKILLLNGQILKGVEICRRFHLKANQVHEAFNELEEKGIGKIVSVRSGTKISKEFHKISISEVKNDLLILNKLQEFVSLEDYELSFSSPIDKTPGKKTNTPNKSPYIPQNSIKKRKEHSLFNLNELQDKENEPNSSADYVIIGKDEI